MNFNTFTIKKLVRRRLNIAKRMISKQDVQLLFLFYNSSP